MIARVPEVKTLATLRSEQFMNAYGGEVSPDRWADLARRINAILRVVPETAGIAITHGKLPSAATTFAADDASTTASTTSACAAIVWISGGARLVSIGQLPSGRRIERREAAASVSHDDLTRARIDPDIVGVVAKRPGTLSNVKYTSNGGSGASPTTISSIPGQSASKRCRGD